MERGSGGEVKLLKLPAVLDRADALMDAGDFDGVIDFLTPIRAANPGALWAVLDEQIGDARAARENSEIKQALHDELDGILALVSHSRRRERGIALLHDFRRAHPTMPIPPGIFPAVTDILLPPFAWCPVTAGSVTLEDGDGRFDVAAFQIAKYPITNAQYQTFIDAGGYADARWWAYSPDAQKFWEAQGKQPEATGFDGDDTPRTNVSWYESVAFCHWLAFETGLNIRLPLETEWQRAAQGDDGRAYPWGNTYDPNRCNAEQRIGRTTPVTKYDFPPKDKRSGVSPFGAVDMAGNVREWCANTDKNPIEYNYNISGKRVLHGGSWNGTNTDYLRAPFRNGNTPGDRYYGLGFRCSAS